MKLYATIENEKGKIDGVGGNEMLTIALRQSNQVIGTLYMTLDDTDLVIDYAGNSGDSMRLEEKKVKGKSAGK